MEKLLLRGGTVYDGTGAAPVRADVLLAEGTVAAIAPDLPAGDARCLDVRGKAVTPGFLDSHRHGDFAAFTDPAFGTAELAQGITTALVGNCGMSAAPVTQTSRAPWYAFLEPCLGRPPAGREFGTFEAYLRALEAQGVPLELGALVGMGTLITAARGWASGPWETAQADTVRALLCEALDAGALGISCGIMYVPECYSTAQDYARLLRPAARYGRPLCCHLRGEGDSLVQAVAEAVEIAARAGVPLNISHFKVFGRQNWGRTLPRAVEVIEAARAKGQDVTVDFYPYCGGSTTLLTLVPPCCSKATVEETLAYLATSRGVEQLRREILRPQPGWDNMVQSIGWERVLLSSVVTEQNRPYQGLDLTQIAARCGDADEAACMARLLCEEAGKAGIIVMSMSGEDVDLVARLPYAAVISDALYGAPDHPHPRLYGAFPRVLHDLVQQRGVLTLTQAVHKMTGLTARRFGLADRGLLRPGLRADVNVFDPALVRDTATFARPKALAAGLDLVLLGGVPAWEKGARVPGAAGRVLRAPQS